MLSRVAENLYWLGRWTERAENTARAVNVNANLLMDLPRGIAPGWQPLIAITGSDADYRERYNDYDERSVVRFLVGDSAYPGSILSSLVAARENARTIRDIVPREAWEVINEIYLYARDNVQSGLSKRGRHAFLRRVIGASQTLTGVMSGTMNHDAGHRFLSAGRMLERADMTTRILDVRSASLLALEDSTSLRPFGNVQWVSVLKSLTAYQMYRRKMQVQVRRADALRFLLQDREFPRAFFHCVSEAEEHLGHLPRSEAPRRALGTVKRAARRADIATLAEQGDKLHTFMDRLQIGLGVAHAKVAETWFLPEA